MNGFTRIAIFIALITIISFVTTISGDYVWAKDTGRITRGAAIGGAAGLLFGGGLGNVLKGAVIGGGVGAATAGGSTGRQAREKAKTGAAVGAGIGILTGHGLSGALQGGLYGGAAGAIYGGVKKK